MTVRFLSLVGVALLAGCAHVSTADRPSAGPDACSLTSISSAEASIRIPFEIVQGRVYIQARVNGGGPYIFAVDTGASGMGRADASLTRALDLPITSQTETSDGINSATVDMTRLETLEIGGFVRKNLDVITRDYSSKAPPGAAISGIVGREFFADGLLVIDFPGRTLIFSRDHHISPDDPHALPYERAFRVPVSIGDMALTGNLDTGANIHLVLPRTIYEQVQASELEAAGQGTLTNTVIETGKAVLKGPVRVGGLSRRDVDIRVPDRYPELLVGGKFLQKATVAIDQRSRRVAICPPGGM